MSNWYCIRTATRQEFKVIDGLHEVAQEHAITLDAYLPCETRWSRSGRVRKRRQTPLIPGYLFLSIAPEHLWRVEDVFGVYAVLRTGGAEERGAAVVDPEELGRIRLAEIAGDFDFTKEGPQPKFVKGAKYGVVGGKASGFIGELMETPKGKRAKLLVTIFGRTKPIEVLTDHIQPLDAEEAAAA